jgi:hypothetical protein
MFCIYMVKIFTLHNNFLFRKNTRNSFENDRIRTVQLPLHDWFFVSRLCRNSAISLENFQSILAGFRAKTAVELKLCVFDRFYYYYTGFSLGMNIFHFGAFPLSA